MHQLKALIWKTYKVRLRSPLTTALDTAGPFVVIGVYICLKVFLGSISGSTLTAEQQSRPLFAGSTGNLTSGQLARLTCTKVLYFSSLSRSDLKELIGQQCALEVVETGSREDLILRLSESLRQRIEYVSGSGVDLRRLKESRPPDGCFTLPGSSGPLHELGLVLSKSAQDEPVLEVHSTDSAGHQVIHQPYSQGSSYNEYRFPQGDLNTGQHLLEMCIRRALFISGGGGGKSPQIGNKTNTNISSTATGYNSIHVGSFPVIAASQVPPILFLIFQCLSIFCNAISTVMRISEDNESGLHRYIRLSGVPAVYYWISQLIVISIHMTIQTLIMAVLLAWPTDSPLLDPIAETSITFRWLLLLTFTISGQVFCLFLGSLLHKMSQGCLVGCLLAICFAMYAITFLIQWTPYNFSYFYLVINFQLFNPLSTYMALLTVLFAIQLHSGDTLGWSSLSSSIIGGGMSSWSAAALWLHLIWQIFFWLAVVILIDQLQYCSSFRPAGLAVAVGELIGCRCLVDPMTSPSRHLSQSNNIRRASKATKAVSDIDGIKSMKSNRDPNRVCCSLRKVTVLGPYVSAAYTKNDPLKFSKEQLRLYRSKVGSRSLPGNPNDHRDKSPVTNAHHATNTTATTSVTTPNQRVKLNLFEEEILLDEALQKNLLWRKNRLQLDNLNLDFRFNQISFVLGATSLKELLFSSLLGLHSIQSGKVVLDESAYSPATMFMARPHIGYLGERDIFLQEMSIFENLQLFGSFRDPSYTRYDSESSFLLNLLHLAKRRDHLPASLTYRSARKLALAVAAVGHTKLLLLVEPTLSLHWRPRCQVLNLLRKYKSIRSIVVDTSDVDEASTFGDRIVLLDTGQSDLDGHPEKLARKFGCGYLLTFEVAPSDKERQHHESAGVAFTSKSSSHMVDIKALEMLTTEVFRQDKIDHLLTTQKHSDIQEVYTLYRKDQSKDSGQYPRSRLFKASKNDLGSAIQSASVIGAGALGGRARDIESRLPIKRVKSAGSGGAGGSSGVKSALENDVREELRGSSGFTLRVRHSARSNQALCTILKMFSQHGGVIHGFNLVQLSYQSLEDVLVLRISKAVYPNLPADMLISLQHKAQTYKQQLNDGAPPASNSKNPLISGQSDDLSQTRLHKWSSEYPLSNMFNGPQMFRAKMTSIIKDRLNPTNELFIVFLAFLISLLILYLAVLSCKVSLEPSSLFPSDTNLTKQTEPFLYDNVDELYRQRIGFYVIATSPSDEQAKSYLDNWRANDKLKGFILRNITDSDSSFVAKVIEGSKDQIASMIVLDPNSARATILFEPRLAHSMIAALRAGLNFLSSQSNSQKLSTVRYQFFHPWHEIMQGYKNRRFLYGIGLSLAEGISIGALVWAPMRHRKESRDYKLRVTYWIAMGLVDLFISLMLISGYITIIVFMENLVTFHMISVMLLVLILYKISVIPLAYLVALIADTAWGGFGFVLLSYTAIGWTFSTHVRTFIEWIIYDKGYMYTLAKWVTLVFPISSLIESLGNISHIGRINLLCSKVPAYTATGPQVAVDGSQEESLTDELLSKVDECLKNGKKGISTYVLNQDRLGIIWCIVWMSLFAVITWLFLLTSERVFGLLARRFTTSKDITDPMKGLVRKIPEQTHSMFRWDRERERLVSEYIRCINEASYVKLMSHNCLYLRLWLKPLSEHQTSVEQRLAHFLDPIIQLGQPRGDIHIDLKTTLQVFIRIGNESNRYKVNKIALIEAYSKFIKENSTTLSKFVVIDWSSGNLYQILLHGHYNTKTMS